MTNPPRAPAGAEIDLARAFTWVASSLGWPPLAPRRLTAGSGLPALAAPGGKLFLAVSTNNERALERGARSFLAGLDQPGSALVIVRANGAVPPHATVACRASGGLIADVAHACDVGLSEGRVVLQAPGGAGFVIASSGSWALSNRPYESWPARASALAQASYAWAATALISWMREAA